MQPAVLAVQERAETAWERARQFPHACHPALLAAGLIPPAGAVRMWGPAHDCGKLEAGRVEKLVCRDPALTGS